MYLVTGLSNVTTRLKVEIQGEDFFVNYTYRDFVKKNVTSIDDIVPSLYYFHYNYQLISSLMYDMSVIFGNEKVLEFIKWMDALEAPNELIPILAYNYPHESHYWEGITNFKTLDPEDPVAEKTAIINNLYAVGFYMRAWLRQSHLNETDRAMILSLLEKRGI